MGGTMHIIVRRHTGQLRAAHRTALIGMAAFGSATLLATAPGAAAAWVYRGTPDVAVVDYQAGPVRGNVLANDVTTPRVSSVPFEATTTGGHLVLTAEGTYTFTAAPGFSGLVVFALTACERAGTPEAVCDTTDLSITVAPHAVPDEVTVAAGHPWAGSAATNDVAASDAVWSVKPSAAEGLTMTSTGDFTFTPPAGFAGTASFPYQVCLPVGGDLRTQGKDKPPVEHRPVCRDAAVNIRTVTPGAVDDTASTAFETTVTGDASTNDSALPGSTYRSVTTSTTTRTATRTLARRAADAESFTMAADGTWTFTPASGFTGVATLPHEFCLPAPLADQCYRADLRVTVAAASPTSPPATPTTSPSVTPSSADPESSSPTGGVSPDATETADSSQSPSPAPHADDLTAVTSVLPDTGSRLNPATALLGVLGGLTLVTGGAWALTRRRQPGRH